jgi:UDP-N-acetylglucosamine 2-epimerase (non-hydrolysing)
MMIDSKPQRGDVDIVTIAGNRPEIIKMSELVKMLSKSYKNAFVYTGQHFSTNMRDVFFEELGVTFDYDLRSNTSDISILRENIRKLLKRIQPTYVIVYGDTNSTVAGALAAKDCGCELFHIEAGLRCFDQSKPEEINRIQVDAVSDYYLAPTELSKSFLKYEGVPEERIFVTGNLVSDVCRKFYQNIKDNARLSELPTEYVLLTIHRPARVDNQEMLESLSRFLSKVNYKIIFPIHPRTKSSLAKYDIALPDNVMVIDAVGYSEFLSLMKDALIILTDSGGVQEESIILKKPCITLNSTTERQETILLRANRLYHPIDGPEQQSSINDIIREMLGVKISINPYGENVTNEAFSVIGAVINNCTKESLSVVVGRKGKNIDLFKG